MAFLFFRGVAKNHQPEKHGTNDTFCFTILSFTQCLTSYLMDIYIYISGWGSLTIDQLESNPTWHLGDHLGDHSVTGDLNDFVTVSSCLCRTGAFDRNRHIPDMIVLLWLTTWHGWFTISISSPAFFNFENPVFAAQIPEKDTVSVGNWMKFACPLVAVSGPFQAFFA